MLGFLESPSRPRDPARVQVQKREVDSVRFMSGPPLPLFGSSRRRCPRAYHVWAQFSVPTSAKERKCLRGRLQAEGYANCSDV